MPGPTTPPVPTLLSAAAAFGDLFPGIRSGDFVALYSSGGIDKMTVSRVSATYLVVDNSFVTVGSFHRSDGFEVRRKHDGTFDWSPRSTKNAGMPTGPSYIRPWTTAHEEILHRRRLARELRHLGQAIRDRIEAVIGDATYTHTPELAEDGEARRLHRALTDLLRGDHLVSQS